MSFDVETNNPAHQADDYYKKWKQLREIGREVFERGNKKVCLGHAIVCNLTRMLNLYEPLNEEAYYRLQQRRKEGATLDAQWIYDWIYEEKSTLKIVAGWKV